MSEETYPRAAETLVPTPRLERLQELLGTRPLDRGVRMEAIGLIVEECREFLRKDPPSWPFVSPVPVGIVLAVVLLSFEDAR